MFIYVLGNKIMIDLNADCKTDFFKKKNLPIS